MCLCLSAVCAACVCVRESVCACVHGLEESGSLIASASLPTLKWPLPQGRDSWLYGERERAGSAAGRRYGGAEGEWEGPDI